MKDQIIQVIEEVLMVPSGTITEDTMIDDIEEWDSLAHVMIIGALAERLKLVIPLEKAIEITGVKDILKYTGD